MPAPLCYAHVRDQRNPDAKEALEAAPLFGLDLPKFEATYGTWKTMFKRSGGATEFGDPAGIAKLRELVEGNVLRNFASDAECAAIVDTSRAFEYLDAARAARRENGDGDGDGAEDEGEERTFNSVTANVPFLRRVVKKFGLFETLISEIITPGAEDHALTRVLSYSATNIRRDFALDMHIDGPVTPIGHREQPGRQPENRVARCPSNLQPDFNVSVRASFDASPSVVLRELEESNRFVQKSAESTSIRPS